MRKKQKLKKRIISFLHRNRRYEVIQQEGLNVLVETEASRAKRAERRDIINIFFSFISAVAAVVASVFAALAYINS